MKIDPGASDQTLTIGSRSVRLTNLSKLFWPQRGIAKRDLLQYYLEIAPVLLPHIRDRAMVMKRYPHGADGPFFFMKRTPTPHPDWLQTCAIEHKSGSVIDFPMIDDAAALLWVVNLGCIDLNQWYATCDDINRPDYVHFDLDPGDAAFSRVRETALILRDALSGLKMPAYAKTSGSKGIHVYVPVVRGPLQKEVWTFAKSFAFAVAKAHPDLVTAEYKIAKRPANRVLVDYNQNRWGATLASIYSVRPTPQATVSTPVTWEEIENGCEIADYRIDSVPERVKRLGDLWKPLVSMRGRFDLTRLIQ
ncbi:MAG: non-homologous end-joining DNA ligase [Candidatus Eremiobacteraeota bacterium]|nr:non-homologous end-joining DNA ligase [Candidatus Eremiobacteraeota bacterium]